MILAPQSDSQTPGVTLLYAVLGVGCFCRLPAHILRDIGSAVFQDLNVIDDETRTGTRGQSG
jgi:hypothetical protein